MSHTSLDSEVVELHMYLIAFKPPLRGNCQILFCLVWILCQRFSTYHFHGWKFLTHVLFLLYWDDQLFRQKGEFQTWLTVLRWGYWVTGDQTNYFYSKFWEGQWFSEDCRRLWIWAVISYDLKRHSKWRSDFQNYCAALQRTTCF